MLRAALVIFALAGCSEQSGAHEAAALKFRAEAERAAMLECMKAGDMNAANAAACREYAGSQAWQREAVWKKELLESAEGGK